MQRKVRVTGFARFFLVMIVIAPLAYIAASFYNGEDGIANIKRLLGIDKSAPTEERFVPSEQPEDEQEMEEALDKQQQRLQQLKAENEKLKKEIQQKEEELSKLRNQQ